MFKNTILKFTLFITCAVVLSCTKGPFGELSELNFAPAKLTFDKQTYSFGEVGVGSAALTKFTLYNISQIEAIGCETLELSDNTNFAVYSSTCDKENMQPNETCEVEVLSQPQSIGTKTLTLSRKCENTEVTTTENEITAIAFVPDLSWSPLTKNFGSIYVGANSTNETFTLTNNGLASATGCSAPVLADAVNFQIVSDTCASNNLAAAATCQVQVRARPQSTGNKKAHLYRTCAVGGTVSTTPNQIRVDGVLTNLAWSPLTYDFGTVNVGDATIDQQFNLSNTGTAAATFCGLPSLSDTTNFSITADTCALNNLTHGSSCFVRVAASPQSAGLKQATLSRTCTVGGTVTTQVDQITVTGNSPTIAWSPQSHDFGTFNVGQSSSSQTFTLTNNTALDATMCWAPYTDDWTGTFSLSNDTCQNNDLLASQSCSVDITATPQQAGYTRATLYRDCWSSGSYYTQSQQIVVRGNGPVIDVNPTYLDLGYADPGVDTTVQNVTFTNTGTQGDINCSIYAPWDAANFTLVSTTCGSTLAAGSSCTASVKGHPQTSNNFGDSVSYYCDNSGTSASLEVTGNGPLMTWNPNYHDFGGIDVGLQSSDLVLTLTNSSHIAATGCLAPYLGDGTHFTLVSTTCGATLAGSGGSCTATVRGSPQSGGSHNDYISYDCTNGNAYASFDEIGNGPLLSVSPNGAYYGTVNVGDTSSAQTFTFQNNGNQNATGCGAPVLSNSTDFSISSNLCGTASIGSGGGYCTVDVVANPASSGTKQTTLSRTCTVGGVVSTTTNNIQVQAVVNAPDLSWSPLTHDFGDIVVGNNSGATNIILTNNGTQPATGCSAPVLSDTTNFSITWQNCNTNDVSAYGSSCTVQIRANPTSSGLKQADLSRTCTAGGTVSTTTNGIQATGVLTASWLAELGVYNLGQIKASGGESDNYKFYFINKNSQNLTGCSAPSLTNSNDFTIVNDGCGAGISPANKICVVEVKANPLVIGAVNTTLSRTCTESGTTSTYISSEGMDNSPVVKISTAWVTNCVLTAAGKVKCWGGANQSRKPFEISGLTNMTDIDVAVGGQGCGIQSPSGTVKCWNFGLSSSTVLPDIGLNSAISISTAQIAGMGLSTCAVISDGTIKCWGNNTYGQLGDGSNTNSSVPVTVSGISNATKVSVAYDQSAGYAHACAALSDGTVKCWGYNNKGQLGDTTTNNSATPVVASGISNAIDVKVSGGHSCALLNDGTAKCWGYNHTGQVGNGTTSVPGVSTPTLVSGLTNAVKIVLDEYSSSGSCALLNDNSLQCWGSHSRPSFGGSCITATCAVANTFTAYTGINDFGIGDSVCSVMNDNTVKCVGGNNYGSLSADDINSVYGTPWAGIRPTIVRGISNIAELTTGGSNCARLNNGEIKCWGPTSGALLGYGSATGPVYAPVSLPSVAGINNAISVDAGGSHNCAVLTDNTVKCWGSNSYGEIGHGGGAGATAYTPAVVTGINNAAKVNLGYSHSCALLSDSSIKCWGNNQYGQLGNGATSSFQNTPVVVSGIANAVQIDSGNYHTCALLTDNSIKCWGGNFYGELGDGTTTSSSVPVTVAGISNAVSVKAGGMFTCAILSTGEVKCWGTGTSGQLGDGLASNSVTPVLVSGIIDAVELSVGGGGVCARLASGGVKCWGINASGQLGVMISSTSNILVPTPEISMGTVTSLSAGMGSNFRCDVLSTDQVQCYGFPDLNNYYRGYFRDLVYQIKGL